MILMVHVNLFYIQEHLELEHYHCWSIKVIKGSLKITVTLSIKADGRFKYYF